MSEPNATPSAVAAIAIKLPTFWPNQAAVWFLQAEAQFAIRGVTADDTKYYHVVSALDQDSAARVLDALQNPPDTGKYAALKARLLNAYTLTEQQRAAALLSISALGEEKPSMLMDRMLCLVGDHRPCFIFRELFLRALPTEVRAAVANFTGELRDLAAAADQVWLARAIPVCATVVVDANDPTPDEVAAISRGKAPPRKPHTENRPRHQNKPAAKAGPSISLCRWHRQYGAAAYSCIAPCSWVDQGNGKASRQ